MRRLLLFILLVIIAMASEEDEVDIERNTIIVPKSAFLIIHNDIHKLILSFLNLQDYATYSCLNKNIYQNTRTIFFLLCSYHLLYGFSSKFQFIGKKRKLASQILLENILAQYIQICQTPNASKNWIIFQYIQSAERPLKPEDLKIQYDEEGFPLKDRLYGYIYNPENHIIFKTRKMHTSVDKPWIYTASSPMPLFIHYTLWYGHRYDFLARYTKFEINTVTFENMQRVTTITCRDSDLIGESKRYREFWFKFDEKSNSIIEVRLTYRSGHVQYNSSSIVKHNVLVPDSEIVNEPGFTIYSVITSDKAYYASITANKELKSDVN